MLISFFFRNGLREALFIELQGTFEIDGDLSGDAFGEMLWRGKERTPMLFIQHQMYVGEVKPMKKPFLIMDRRTVRDDPERAGDKKVRTGRSPLAWAACNWDEA